MLIGGGEPQASEELCGLSDAWCAGPGVEVEGVRELTEPEQVEPERGERADGGASDQRNQFVLRRNPPIPSVSPRKQAEREDEGREGLLAPDGERRGDEDERGFALDGRDHRADGRCGREHLPEGCTRLIHGGAGQHRHDGERATGAPLASVERDEI